MAIETDLAQAQLRNQSLDTLRGMAILLVLIGHYLKFAPYQLGGLKLGDWVTDFGHGGVLLFFLLSGFLIWKTANRNPLAVFLVRRLAKIVPAYWVNVLFVALMGMAVAFYPSFGIKDILGNLAFLAGSFGIEAMSGVYWTLIVEIKFYLLFALVFYSPLRRVFWLVPLAALMLNLAVHHYSGRSSTFLIYLPAFFIGAAFAADFTERQRQIALVAMVTMACLGLIWLAPYRGWQAAAFLVVDVALFMAVTRSGLQIRWLVWLGVISYSVYLYHMTLGAPLFQALSSWDTKLWPLICMGITLLVGIVSVLSYNAIETRFVRLAHHFRKKRGQAFT